MNEPVTLTQIIIVIVVAVSFVLTLYLYVNIRWLIIRNYLVCLFGGDDNINEVMSFDHGEFIWSARNREHILGLFCIFNSKKGYSDFYFMVSVDRPDIASVVFEGALSYELFNYDSESFKRFLFRKNFEVVSKEDFSDRLECAHFCNKKCYLFYKLGFKYKQDIRNIDAMFGLSRSEVLE